MSIIKFYLKELLKYFIFLIIYLLFITTINYFTNINQNTISIINYVIIIISSFIFGFLTSKKIQKKALIHGILLSTFICFTFLILNILFKEKLQIFKLVYYIIIYISLITGSIVRRNINY